MTKLEMGAPVAILLVKFTGSSTHAGAGSCIECPAVRDEGSTELMTLLVILKV